MLNLKEKKEAISNIVNLLKTNRSFLITGHIRPDGDTIGSELALASWLKKERKSVDIVNSDPVPDSLKFLADTCGIAINRKPGKQFYDVGIILECPNISRVGGVIEKVRFGRLINIDHHIETGNICGGGCNLLVPEASSCSELIYYIMDYAGYKLTPNDAMCLYTGIITDTGRFQQSNTTPEVLRVAARLMEYGLDSTYIYKNVYGTKPVNSLRFLGTVLSTLKVEGCVSYLTITRDVYRKHGAKEQDSEDLINYAGMVPGVKIFALFREMLDRKDMVKISLRSYGNINVNSVAKEFGGGGHFHASGFELKGSMDKVLKKVIAHFKKSA